MVSYESMDWWFDQCIEVVDEQTENESSETDSAILSEVSIIELFRHSSISPTIAFSQTSSALNNYLISESTKCIV